LSTPIELTAVAVFFFVVVSAYYRLRVGVNFDDEAYYAVLTQRFALGDRPYVDEINLRQSAALLTAPFYWAYLEISGSTDGVVYFLRQMFFALQFVVALAVFAVTRTRLRLAEALLAAAVPMAFIPFAIPACGYNNLGSLLFTLGTCAGLVGILRPGPLWTLVVAGGVHALACVAYLPLIVPVAVSALCATAATSRDRALRATGAYVLGIAAVGGCFAFLIGPDLISGLPSALEYERMFTADRNLDKLGRVMSWMVRLAPGGLLGLPALGVSLLLANRVRGIRHLLPLLVVPLLWWFLNPPPEFGGLLRPDTLSLHVSVYLGILTGFFLLFWPPQGAKPLFLWGWLPSMVAGVVTGVSSDNLGSMNVGVGMFAAATLLPLTAIPVSESETAGSTRRLPGIFALALVPLMLVKLNETTYFDGPVKDQTSLVKVGPFRGMYTLPERETLATSLVKEIRPLYKPGERMLVFFDLPAAYLVVPTRPAIQTSWTYHLAIIPPLLPYYDRHRTGDGLVVVVNGRSGRSRELENLTEDPSRLLKDVGWIRIYREPPP